MLAAIRGLSMLVLMELVCPFLVQAQLLPNPCMGNPCCNQCQLPPARCVCQGLQPVVETRYRQKPVVTYRNVAETRHRLEPHTETVPVTTYKNVTVDEGGYQTVWVPKLVTKQVAQTIYQQRQAYRSVPYQVTRRVPQYSTQTVAEQTVRHVPYRFQTAWQTSACTTCGPAPAWENTPAVATSASAIPVMPPLTVSSTAGNRSATSSSPTPIPDPSIAESNHGGDYGQWQTVEAREKLRNSQPEDRFDGYQIAPPRDTAATDKRANKFVPAPSAATVWHFQQSAARR